jgi:beta-phosphoglucomutase
MVRAVVFDFNGILVDDEPIHLRLFQRVLAEEGIELSSDDYYRRIPGLRRPGVFRGGAPGGGRGAGPGARPAADRPEVELLPAGDPRRGLPLLPGAVPLVRGLHERGVPLGLVSGALREEIEGALEQESLLSCFKVLVAAEDVERGKPDPEGYRMVLAELNSRAPLPERLLHPHEVTAVEDSPPASRPPPAPA